jgi:fucose 4-O-acetylase-like acetyltransferase
MATGLDALVKATPSTRDRYVDFLRAASIVVVVLGHWMISLIWWQDGVIRSTSAIGRSPGLWAATWIFQVIPVFFFVGGYANYVALQSSQRRGESAVTFVRTRMRRLLSPSLALVGVWAVVEVGLHLAGIGRPTGPRIWGGLVLLRGVAPPGQTIPFGPLWFLGWYLVVVMISPLTVALHRRFRWWVPAVMVAGAVLADGLGFFGGHPKLRYLNVAFVLLLPHQLGHFYGDGSAVRWRRRALLAMMVVGLGGLIALTNPWLFRLFGEQRFAWFPGIGHYPRSLLGTDVEQVSNAYPPTLCFLLVGIWLIGLVMLLRAPLTRWLQRPAVWKATIVVNTRIMTLFLWHMTAYLLAILALWQIGFGHEHEPTLRWWAERPVWILVPGVLLLGIVAAVGRFETRGHGPRRHPRLVGGERQGPWARSTRRVRWLIRGSASANRLSKAVR